MTQTTPVGPVSGTEVPRYAGAATFARLPDVAAVSRFDVAVIGAPFDGGVSYRPGARFGPSAIRQATIQAVDAGDVPCNPFDIDVALDQMDRGVSELVAAGARPVILGGDHTIALGGLRAVAREHGPVALLHLDAHVGIRGEQDLEDDGRFGFEIIRCEDVDRVGLEEIADRVRRRVGDAPLYLSVDIDVLDPAFAPGTGTPEMGGLTSRELLALVRGLPREELVAADIVEVSPAYDHAGITSLAAATLGYEITCLMARAGAA